MPVFRRLSHSLYFFFFAGLLLLASCSDKQAYTEPADALFRSLAPGATGVDFINAVEDGEEFNVLSYRNFYNGAGVAIADLNGDGRNDLYFTANQGPNRLYLNDGDFKFTEVVDAGGAAGAMTWSTGVTITDVDADGKPDIYVCNSGDVNGGNRTNELFLNQGNDTNGQPTFIEAATKFGLADNGFSTQAAWLDYDLDGDLDVYLLNNSYLSPEKISPKGESRNRRDDAGGGDKLLRNDGGTFTDVSEAAGIFGSRIGFGLGSGLGDFNGDGYTDIYISNDFWERDYLYINQGDGTFKEQLNERTDHVSTSSMGSDVADLDNDGDAEIFTTDMLPGDNLRLKASTLFDTYTSEGIKLRADYHYQYLQNCLQVNDGTGNFIETGGYSGVSATDWSWGALIFDLNNDGMKDIFVANGIYRDIMDLDFADFLADKEKVKEMVLKKGTYDWRDFVALLPHNEQPNYAFVNQGQLRFENQARALGLGAPSYSNGSAYGDLDGDGDLELVVNNVNQPALIYQNNSTEGGANFLTVELAGPSGNAVGVGAKVTLRHKDGIQVLEQYPSRGFQSQVGSELVFGLGGLESVESITVSWPDGKESLISQPAINEKLLVAHTAATVATAAKPLNEPTIFASADDLLDQAAEHQEPAFNDFNHEGLLLRKLSDPGPEVVKGDINGDGLEDFILLGSWGYQDRLYLQQADGSFRFKNNSSLSGTAKYESTCGAIFDADGDGDQDLMIGSGGNEYARGFEAYSLRYYENIDGVLVFNLSQAPLAGGEISCIVPADIDFDGDMDVFLGGRAVPGNYGMIPQSFLFIRDKGSWVNQTPKDIATAGMVTDAVWTDMNGDTRPDLVMVGDWMPITMAFMLNGGEISSTFQVPNSAGWWTSVEAADLDADGKQDLILTNWGRNSKLKASAERPLELHLNDYDKNQKSEFIIDWYPPNETTNYPFASKRDLQAQLPSLKKKTLKYKDYAAATYETLFTEEERAGSLELRCDELRSSVIWNLGEGNVRIEPLPWQAQLTTQFTTAIGDVNGDGRADLWLGGNIHGVAPQLGRSDAGRGTLLLNEGDRKWRYVDNATAGINLKGQVRDAKYIDLADGGKALMVGLNDEAMRVFRLPFKGVGK